MPDYKLTVRLFTEDSRDEVEEGVQYLLREQGYEEVTVYAEESRGV